jgi:hypothetical protein
MEMGWMLRCGTRCFELRDCDTLGYPKESACGVGTW